MDIPEEILEDARRASGHRTKRQTVISGLEELVKKAKREELRRLAGKMSLKIDLARSRRRRAS